MREFAKFFMATVAICTVLWGNESVAQVLDDSANVKILKVRSSLLEGDTTQKYSAGQLNNYSTLEEQIRATASCGSIDIGNQDVNSNFAGEINIIIAGDIMNTGTNCK